MIAVKPAEILRELGAVGITLTVLEPDRLIAKPTERVTPEIKEALRENKPEIIKALRTAKNPELYPPELPPLTATPRDLARAAQMGLCATWARKFGYVSLHDPDTGEWHDIPTRDANSGAEPRMISEAQRRKRLWRKGWHDAFNLNREQMESVWAEERRSGIVSDPGVAD